MISPLIKWNHSEDYFVPLMVSHDWFDKRSVLINISDKEFEHIQGHVIDGKFCFLQKVSNRIPTPRNPKTYEKHKQVLGLRKKVLIRQRFFNRKSFIPRNWSDVPCLGNIQHVARKKL